MPKYRHVSVSDFFLHIPTIMYYESCPMEYLRFRLLCRSGRWQFSSALSNAFGLQRCSADGRDIFDEAISSFCPSLRQGSRRRHIYGDFGPLVLTIINGCNPIRSCILHMEVVITSLHQAGIEKSLPRIKHMLYMISDVQPHAP